MKKKTLILLTDCYPVSAGEFFLEDEMRIIAPRFEKIYVVVKAQKPDGFPFFVPENMEVITFDSRLGIADKLKGILLFGNSFFRKEMKYARRNYKRNEWSALFKIMFIELLQAKQIQKVLENLHAAKLKDTDNYYYSYWNSRNALALALLEDQSSKKISRAHGWDVFTERHSPAYLPFKHFMTSRLDQTLSISEAGKQEFLKVLGNELEHKISVARLGKINHREFLLQKKGSGFLFCSCSNLIPLKRVHLIIAFLKTLGLDNMQWVHFGDGPLMEELKQLAQIEIPDIKVDFRGNKPNAEILDFYAQNYVDLFLNFSEYEGIPVSIMEAISAGIPVLATDVGGVGEIVLPKHGFLVAKDFEMLSLKETIKQYLASSEADQIQFREGAHDFWAQHYNAEKNYTDFLEQLFTQSAH